MNNGTEAANDMPQMRAVPVNQAVIQCLQEALERARRGEFTSLVLVGARNADQASFDSIVVDNIPNGVMMLGALDVARAKLTAAFMAAQNQQSTSRILRPAPGMPSL